MRTRPSSNLVGETSTNPKRRNRKCSKQIVEPFSLEETPVDTMADQRTMEKLLQAPTEGYGDAIVIPAILAENFELKHGLLNLVTSKPFYGFEKEDPHAHIRWFSKITSTIKYRDVPNTSIKLMLFPFSIEGAAQIWLEKEPPRSILTWEDLVSKFINQFFPPSKTTNLRNEITNFQQKFEETFSEAWDRFKDLLRACPHHGFTELHQLDTFYNALNSTDQDSLNAAAGGNLLTKTPRDALTIIENKSKVRNAQNKPIVSRVSTNSPSLSNPHSPKIAALVDAVKAMLHQKSSPPTSVNTVEEICVTYGGPHPYHQCLATDGNVFPEFQDNIQRYVSAAAVNYNQGNTGYRPQSIANQIRPPGFAQPNVQNNQNQYNQGYNQNRGTNQVNQSYQAPIQQPQVAPSNELSNYKRIIDTNMKAMQNQINNVKNELRNEMQTSIQASMSNQTNELKNMMASFFQMNTASSSGSGSLPSNTIANPKGELKAITTRSGIVLDGPSVPMPPPFINPEEDERAEETLTDPELVEYTIKVPPPLVQKPQAPSQKSYEMPKRDPLHPNIPYPSRMNKEKQQDKDEIQIHKFWQMFKQLHINISLADALILIPKYQKMLKALLSNKEKLLELANTPLNENCSAVILKKLPEKLGDPGKFLIPCSFSELNCKALADLGASINLMPLSVWKKLGLSELISTRMTLELANRSVCTPAGIARDVFVPVGRFTFPADFVIVDYESDPRVPLILGRPFLRTARALIDIQQIILLRISHDELASYRVQTTGNDDMPPDDENKIKDSKLLVDELDSPGSSSFLPHFLQCDSVLYEDFSEVDTLTLTDNEDKVFNPGILVHENHNEVTNRVTPDKNVKMKSSSNVSLILEDYNPPLFYHELPFHIEIPGSETLLSFLSKNEESQPTKVEVPKELPKVSMVNMSLKKLKHHLASFDVVVKERTMATTITEGSWGFEHTKACFRDEIILFCLKLETDLLNKKDFVEKEIYDKLFRSYTTLEKHCISLEVDTQLNQENFQRDNSVSNQSAPSFDQYFELNELKAQSQDKDIVIKKLKEIIKSLSGNMNEDKIKKDIEEIETINIELGHRVSKLIADNEHLKQTYKQLYDSIKPTRIRSKEQCDALINQVNQKSVEIFDLNASLQEKVVVIIALKNELRKLKGKDLADNVEQAVILREIVKQGKSQNPLNNSLDFACKYTKRIQELLIIIRQTCPSINNSSDKLVAVTPKNKDKRVRFTKPVTSSGNTNTKTTSSSNPVFNKPMLSSTGVKPSTSASGSQPLGNTKKDKIRQTPSSTQNNKVEAHSRTVKSSLKNKNCVEPKGSANVQNSKLIANSKILCVKCNGCMLSDNHDLCVLDFINDLNARAKSKSVKKSLETNSKGVHKYWIHLETCCTDTPKPVVTLIYSQKPKKSKTNVPVSKPKIIKSISANKKEPVGVCTNGIYGGHDLEEKDVNVILDHYRA
ncbi:reverse transcriptase domain-containing protein [Tanacetum coccineum]